MNRIPREDFRKTEPISRDCRGLIIATNDEGLIALKPDFVELFSQLTSLPEYYLQTRHAYTTLIARRRHVELRSIKNTNLISDCEESIQLDRTSNHRMYAHVSRCECCGSPGRIEVRNKHNLEVLQICCPPIVKAIDWGKIIALSSMEEGVSHFRSDREHYSFIPKSAKKISSHPSQITKFFEFLRERSIAFVATLETDGVIHREKILAERIECSDEILIVKGTSQTLRLDLAAALSLFSLDVDGSNTIYVAGDQNVQLLSIKVISSAKTKKYLPIWTNFFGEDKVR